MSASRVRKNANTRTRVHSRRTGISSKSKRNGALQDTCSHANGAPANAGETERRLNRTIGELRHFIESASLGMHWVGPDGIILWANAADMDLLGYGRDDYIGHHIAEFHADPPVIEEILERLSRGEKVHEYEARLKCKDGSIKNVLINSSVYWEDGKFIHTQCFTRDVTDRKHAAQRLSTQHAVTRTLAESAGLAEAAPKLIRAVCESANWEVGAMWELDKAAGLMRCIDVSSSVPKAFPRFDTTTRGRTFSSGTGIPGRVWSEGAPVWIPDVTRDGNFPRATIAAEEGLHSAFAFPIGVAGQVYGVMEFFSRKIRQPQKELLELLASFGSQIGQFIERKRAEETLRQSERRFREMIDALPVAIYTTDAEGRLTHFNRAAVEFSGRTPEVGTDQWCVTWKLFHADGTPMRHDECPMAIALKEGRIVRGVEAIAERADGSRIWFTPFPTALRDDKGRIIGGINMLLDITERKQAQAASARLAAIVQSSDDAIVSKDLTGIIQTWNQSAERLFGYTPSEAIGQPIMMLIPAELRDEEREILRRIRSGEMVDHYETIRRRKDGTLLNLSLSISPIRNERGEIIGASKIARDITERKRTEAALVRAQEELRQHAVNLEKTVAERTAKLRETIAELEAYSYSISHDMRAPLRAMQTYAHVLLTDHRDQIDATGKRYLDRIMTSSVRLDKLIQDVLSYSRIARGDVKCEPINLDRLVADICNEYPAVHASELEIRPPLGSVVAAESLLAQALSNLLTNAAKFVAPGETARIKIWSEEITTPETSNRPFIRVYIQDRGIGIAQHDQPRIFAIFARVYCEKEYEGTGIGLSIAKKAIERMGGSLGLESELGKGSTFWIQLPKA